MKAPQPSLFATGILCAHCQTDPCFGKNPALWHGFLDKDTGQQVCWSCKGKHYKAKATSIYKNMYSEFPIINPQKI